jgi:hypothetical protein
MKDVEVDVESMTDGELSAALRARGAPYGPIGRTSVIILFCCVAWHVKRLISLLSKDDDGIS